MLFIYAYEQYIRLLHKTSFSGPSFFPYLIVYSNENKIWVYKKWWWYMSLFDMIIIMMLRSMIYPIDVYHKPCCHASCMMHICRNKIFADIHTHSHTYLYIYRGRQEEGEHAELSSMSMLEKGSHVCSLSSVAFLISIYSLTSFN